MPAALTDATPAEAHAALDRVRTVLVRTSHPGNIGAAARALWTMGLSSLVLVEPRHFPAAEASARATGAEALLERARADVRRTRAAHARGGARGRAARGEGAGRPGVRHRDVGPVERRARAVPV